MKSKVSLLFLLLLWAQNVYAWDSDNATTTIFQIFYIPLFILFLISFKWAKNSTLVKIVVTILSLGLVLVLLALAVMFHEDRHPVFFKTVGGFLLLILFTFARKKDKKEEEF